MNGATFEPGAALTAAVSTVTASASAVTAVVVTVAIVSALVREIAASAEPAGPSTPAPTVAIAAFLSSAPRVDRDVPTSASTLSRYCRSSWVRSTRSTSDMWSSLDRITTGVRRGPRSGSDRCALLGARLGGRRRASPASRPAHDTGREERQLDDRDREPVQEGDAECGATRRHGEEQAVHRRLPGAETGGQEDREHGDDRADRRDAAEERDRGDPGVAAEAAQEEVDGDAAEDPRAAVEEKQQHGQRERQRFDPLRAERPQQLAGERPEDPRVEERREQHREEDERQERRVD